MGTRVQRIKTTVSEPQMANAIIEAWTDLFGAEPTKEQVSMVLAQNSLETGNRKSMWNYNVGNITTDGKGSYDYFNDLTTDEQTQPGVWKKMNLKYRAYPSLLEGTKDYLRLLSGKHYAAAWQHILHPDPVAFSKALKAGGYYTANEAPYTKALIGHYNRISNSDSYEKAKSGQVPQMMATRSPSPANDIMSVLNEYLQQITAKDRQNKGIYKKILPNNEMVIRITSSNHTEEIEFARILCTALNEELLADAFTHTNGIQTEISCSIPGPRDNCFELVKQLAMAVAEAFEIATKKIGGIQVKTKFFMNKKSSYEPINFQTSNLQYRKFLLKFV